MIWIDISGFHHFHFLGYTHLEILEILVPHTRRPSQTFSISTSSVIGTHGPPLIILLTCRFSFFYHSIRGMWQLECDPLEWGNIFDSADRSRMLHDVSQWNICPLKKSPVGWLGFAWTDSLKCLLPRNVRALTLLSKLAHMPAFMFNQPDVLDENATSTCLPEIVKWYPIIQTTMQVRFFRVLF